MAINVLALASGVTGLADHRVLEGSFATSHGNISVRSGLFPSTGGGDKSTVSAMVARISPFRAIINNSISTALGPYLFVSTANVDITFDSGEASVPRVDRVIARVRDNANDGSGSTAGSVEYLKGQASGSATAMPNNSLLLYEMTIPAGASAGGGGVNFANMVDSRVYTTASGGIVPVPSAAVMNAITSPHWGQAVYRQDLDALYVFDGGSWRPRGQISVASSASLTNITNPYDGLVAVARDTDAIYVYNGSGWGQPKIPFIPVGMLRQQSAQLLATNTQTAITFGSGSEEFDTYNQHDVTTNPSRVTPNVGGYYRVTGHFSMSSVTLSQVTAAIAKNGTRVSPQATMRPDNASGAASTAQTSAILVMNGSTDYFELHGSQTSAGSNNTNVAAGFESTLSWDYIGPTSY
jgi:hypothetical protein